MTMWVETHFPWYVWDDEEEEDWSIADKKALVEKEEFKKRYAQLQDCSLNPHRGADAEQSKVISMLEARITATASK